MKIKIKYLRDILPVDVSEKGDMIDLRCAEDTYLEQFESRIIPLGVAMELPEGYMAVLVPRSSTFKKWGIIQANSVGIIDESYKGDNDEWCMYVIAMRNTKIHKNDRICQFRIVKKQEMELVEVKTLGNDDRGGFGSTGTI